MGGIFGVVSKTDCVTDLYYGVDYHSHLGTRRGGMAVWDGERFDRSIHNIQNAQFRTKFEDDLASMKGAMGIGCISDTDSQPLLVASHLGEYALTTVGRLDNRDEIIRELLSSHHFHFMQSAGGHDNATELIASLIDQEDSILEGIRRVHRSVKGSCSLLLLTPEGLYAARDYMGRTPLVIGEKEGAYCVAFETTAMPNLGYTPCRELGPGEIVRITQDGVEVLQQPQDKMKICAFLWVYYGFPASTYEGVNVEQMRYRNGTMIAKRDVGEEYDLVAGMPDSGIAHAIGYANERHDTYGRPFAKYNPTWARSFLPQHQSQRNMVARMKMMPIVELIRDKRLLFLDDSIVRGTQIRETRDLLINAHAKEVHMRSACPPIMYPCKYLNFSRSKSEMALITRQTIETLEGGQKNLEKYSDHTSPEHNNMVCHMCKAFQLDSLKFQTLPDMLTAIGLPEDRVCTYCWTGRE